MTTVRALFDAIIAYMGDEWTQTNVYANKDAAGATNCGITCTDKNGNSYTYSERVVGPRVSITPPGANLGPGGAQQFTAAVTDAEGNPVAGAVVTWAVAGGHGTISTSGLYRAPAAITAPTSDTVSATYAATGALASVVVQLHP
jgi:hypothetical protein